MRPITFIALALTMAFWVSGDLMALQPGEKQGPQNSDGQRGQFQRGQFQRGAGQFQQGQGRQRGKGQRGQRGQRGNNGQNNRAAMMKMIFKRVDANGDGKISMDEAPDRMKQGFTRLDTNGDGLIDSAEQQALLQKMSQQGAGQKGQGQKQSRGGMSFESLVARFDKNGDKKLSIDEAPEMMKSRFEMLDTNGDGVFDSAEAAQAREMMAKRMKEGKGKGGNKGRDMMDRRSNNVDKRGQVPKRPDGNG